MGYGDDDKGTMHLTTALDGASITTQWSHPLGTVRGFAAGMAYAEYPWLIEWVPDKSR